MEQQPKRGAYDVVVLGGGIIGLCCAWRVAQRGQSVLLLERGALGSGSSGVAAGMLAPVTEAEFGEEGLLALNLAGAASWPAFSAELSEAAGVPSGYRETGALVVAADRDDGEELRRLHVFQRSLGLDAHWLSPRECRRLEPRLSPRVAGAIHAPHDHQADPAAVMSALVRALDAAGGELRDHAGQVALELDGDRVSGVRTGAGSIASPVVVVAAGAGAALVEGVPQDARPPVRPVKGEILALRGPAESPLATRVIRTPRCYIVPRADGRVVVGATTEERGFDTTVTAGGVHRLLEAAWEVLPDAGELELEGARAGLRPGTPDNAPIIGAAAEIEGLVWATGHHRNGVLLAPITGAAVAAILTGEEPPEPVERFGPARFAAAPKALAGAAQ